MTAQPLFFGPPDAPLFAWYHRPLGRASRGVSVVLCPSIALDFMSAYRSLRVLAEHLAAAGFAVLRPEYRATGNSWGVGREPDQVRAWQDSIDRAAEEVSRRAATDQLVLVGLRLGGTLAALAARRNRASDSLVLWGTLSSGHAYLRELRALVALSQADGYSEVDGELCAAGFVITRSTAEALEELNLLELQDAPARRILLVEEDGRGSTRRLTDRLRELGSDVSLAELPGTAGALAGANYAVVPVPIIERITAWLTERYPRRSGPMGAAGTAEPSGEPASQQRRERTLRFGPDQRLFGILTEPAVGEAPAAALIFLNTGNNHHVGPHRMFVPLARHCAELGIACFRFDFGGLGASAPPPGAAENIPYPDHAIGDIRLAVETVKRETGASRVILAGLCSGGWHAVAAVRQGVPLDGVIAVNPPFYFKGGDPEAAKRATEAVGAAEAGELLRYRRSLGDAAKWKKLFTGRVQLGTVFRLALGQARRFVQARLLPGGLRTGSDTAAELESLATAPLPILLVFDREDPSYLHFDLHLPGRLRKAPRALRWIVVEGAGDTFKPIAAQERLREILLEALREWATD